MNLTGAGEPALLKGARLSANSFDVLGVRPQLGRAFTEVEDRAGQDKVAIISHALWTQRFQSDRSVVGRKVVLDGEPFLVVGVMPDGFRLPSQPGLNGRGSSGNVQFLKPIGYADDDLKHREGEFNWTAFARLRPGVTAKAR